MILSKKAVIILAMLLMSILTGCIVTDTKPMQPIKPRIEAFQIQENTCFNKADASLLFEYIIELEFQNVR